MLAEDKDGKTKEDSTCKRRTKRKKRLPVKNQGLNGRDYSTEDKRFAREGEEGYGVAFHQT